MSRDPSLTIDDLVLKLVRERRIPRSSPHPCPYLDDRRAVEEGFMVEALQPSTYHKLMDLGFRRSGQVFYRPRCVGCDGCVQLRVICEEFKASKSQRRTRRKNADLRLEVGEPDLTDEKFEVYRRYLAYQHPDSRQSGDKEGLREFLYNSAVETIEACYYDEDDRLVAVSILDRAPRSLSSVYHFFDPRERKRSLGVYSVLREIELARELGIPWYYLGYWVEGSPTMDYKANYYPHEILVHGVWMRREKGD